MKMVSSGPQRVPVALVLLVCGMLASGVIFAEETSSPPVEGFGSLQQMETEELEQLRGREGFKDIVTVQSIQNMEAAVSDASFHAGTIITGGINIDAGAMDNISGIMTMNMLTGNGNAVNSGVSVSIYMPVHNP